MMRIFLAGLFVLLATSVFGGEPYRPDNPDAVLARVTPASDPGAARLSQLRKSLDQSPERLGLAVEYARAAIEQSRATADPRYLGYAQSALAPWWDRADPPDPVRLLRATIAQRRHEFGRAIADLDAVLAAQPQHAQARLTRASLHTVQARYEPALLDCAALTGQVRTLIVAACAAPPASLSGSAPAALNALESALAADASVNAGTRVWALTIAAEIADRLGRADLAAERFEQAITAADGDDPYLLNAYADFLLEHGEPAAVVRLLADHQAIDAALLRLAMANKRLAESGNAQAANRFESQRDTLAARFEAAQRRGDTVHRREQAMFELYLRERPERALWLARANWRDQKEPLDARILLEAALAAKAPAEAGPVRQWLEAHSVEAPRLRDLAGQLEAMADPA
ncbi:MAG: hypothetical protein RJQ08_02300 [Salinisphaeraceae bacterium]